MHYVPTKRHRFLFRCARVTRTLGPRLQLFRTDPRQYSLAPQLENGLCCQRESTVTTGLALHFAFHVFHCWPISTLFGLMSGRRPVAETTPETE